MEGQCVTMVLRRKHERRWPRVDDVTRRIKSERMDVWNERSGIRDGPCRGQWSLRLERWGGNRSSVNCRREG